MNAADSGSRKRNQPNLLARNCFCTETVMPCMHQGGRIRYAHTHKRLHLRPRGFHRAWPATGSSGRQPGLRATGVVEAKKKRMLNGRLKASGSFRFESFSSMSPREALISGPGCTKWSFRRRADPPRYSRSPHFPEFLHHPHCGSYSVRIATTGSVFVAR